MAGETISPLPDDLVQWPSISLEQKAQLYPDPTGTAGSTRPTAGQVWPRGNTRGNT